MKILNWVCAGMAVWWGMAVWSETALGQAVPSAKVAGQIGLVSGTVLVDSEKVKTGAPVKVGSLIEVRSNSKATLLLGKGSVFQIGEDSRMLVGEYGITPEQEEVAKLDLKFGKTRALILNQGQRRELKIRTRAATMGVRGTEVFVDSPQDSNQPVQFVTIEGLAEVKLGETAAPIPLPQNQALRSEGRAESGGSQAPPGPVAISPVEIKATLNEGGLPPPPPPAERSSGALLPPPPPGAARGQVGGLSDGFAIGPNAPVTLDPVQDRIYRPLILPQFCDANSSPCN